MFTDVTVCADLTAKFNEYLAESPERELPYTVSLSILQVSCIGSGSGSSSSSRCSCGWGCCGTGVVVAHWS